MLRKYIEDLMIEESHHRRLRVFDFDNTLVETQSKVYVHHKDGTKKSLSTKEYLKYRPRPGDRIDFSEFERLIKPRKIKWTNKVMRRAFERHGSDWCVILTARHKNSMIKKFMKRFGYHGVRVVALGTGKPEAKARWISNEIKKRLLTHIEFFDDSYQNIVAVRKLRQKFSHVKFRLHHVKN